MTMSNLRRSTRATKSKVSYSEIFSPCYPDQNPANEFERRVESLDQQSFPWEELSAVDDLLVYSLFSSKRRTKGYRAIKTERAFGGEDTPVTVKEGVDIRRMIGEYLPERGVRDGEDIEKAARALVKEFPRIFVPQQLSIIEQYVCHVWI